MATVIQDIPASQSRMESIKMATAAERELQSVIKHARKGWPEYSGNAPQEVRAYMMVKNELSEADGLLICGNRVIIPQSLRVDILRRPLDGHQGLTKCRDRASSSVWWPGLSAELKHTVMLCHT